MHCALQIATKEKNAAEERMAVVQAKLDEMQAQFDAAMAQKQLLEDDAAACQKKMDSAAALLHALAGALGQPVHTALWLAHVLLLIMTTACDQPGLFL
jgi:chromosome segregation ATPase